MIAGTLSAASGVALASGLQSPRFACTIREATMRSGLIYAFGLVTAVTVVLVWRHLAGPWIIYLFSRGD